MEQSQGRSRQAHRRWDSDFQEFQSASKPLILKCLRDNYPNSSDSEVQREIGEVKAGLTKHGSFCEYTASDSSTVPNDSYNETNIASLILT